MTTSHALMQLQALHDNLLRYEECAISASALSEQARASGALLDSLPPRYGEVLLALLDRLEAKLHVQPARAARQPVRLGGKSPGTAGKPAATTLKTIAACALIKRISGL